MDAAQMVAAEVPAQPADPTAETRPGAVPAQVAPAAAISAACVEATGRALSNMEQHARNAGYAGT